jgi:hypothetical protein
MTEEPIAAGPNDVTVMPLPCPFCGSHDVAVVNGETFRRRLMICSCCGAQGPDVRVQTCGSGTNEEWERRARAGATSEWNKRHNVELTGVPPTDATKGG